jgi:uncharacterized lipoprotein YmbA
MKPVVSIQRLACGALTATILAGCLFKPSTVPVRRFILSPMATNEPPVAGAANLFIGISPVKMPAFLLRDSIAVRNSANEIEYLEDSLWGERLDQSFQRILVANLSRLMPSASVYSPDWGRGQLTVRVSINVQQFDVDTLGRGTLTADWRINNPTNDVPLKSGTARLNRSGPSPQKDPGAIAVTLSELAAEFSRGLAQDIRDCAHSGH